MLTRLDAQDKSALVGLGVGMVIVSIIVLSIALLLGIAARLFMLVAFGGC